MSTVKKIYQIYSKYFTLLNLIIFWRFITGHYVDLNYSKRVMWTIRMYCVVFIVFVTYNSLDVIASPHGFNVGEFFLSSILSLVTGEKYFFDYFSKTSTNDVIMGNIESLFDLRIKLVIISFLFFRFLMFSINITIQSGLSVRIAKVTFLISTSRFNSVIATIAFLLLYTRMKIIRNRFERNIVPVNIVGKNGIVSKVREVRRCLIHYNNFFDNFMEIDKGLQLLLCITMFFSVPKCVVFTYSSIAECMQRDCVVLKIIAKLLEVIDGLNLACWPALVVELIRYECEKMTQILSKQLVRCSDESLRFELKIALQYISHRPFNYVLCGAVPLSILVPFNFVSLTITYVIVFIQFTHFSGPI